MVAGEVRAANVPYISGGAGANAREELLAEGSRGKQEAEE